MSRVLVTGGTGFTGSRVVPILLEKGYRVKCLIRPNSDRKRIEAYDVEWTKGDLGDLTSLKKAMKGIDALVNIASIGFGHAPLIVDAAVESGVDRTVFISTTALFTTLNAPSKKIRLLAEETIRKSPLAHTILRPTMIYGSPEDRNMFRLIRFLKKYPLIPILGNGKSLQQPVYVKNVASAAANVLNNEKTIGKAYNIPGAEALSMNQVIDIICEQLGKRIMKIHLPVRPFVKGFQIVEKRGFSLPIKSEQILRLNEDKAFSWDAAAIDFGYSPIDFKEGIKKEIRAIGL